MLFVSFLCLARSYHCTETVNVISSSPEVYYGPLGDGDRLGINSTRPYLAIVFGQLSLLRIRYFSRDAKSSMVETGGHFYIPSDISAIGFGDTLGQVEVQALIPGIVHLSVFAYPEACARRRYLSTMQRDAFYIDRRLRLGQFAETMPTSSCLWLAHTRTTVAGEVNKDSRMAIHVCGRQYCTESFVRAGEGLRSFELPSSSYIKLDADRPDFAAKYILSLAVRENSNFLDSQGVFDNDKDLSVIKIRPVTPAPKLVANVGAATGRIAALARAAVPATDAAAPAEEENPLTTTSRDKRLEDDGVESGNREEKAAVHEHARNRRRHRQSGSGPFVKTLLSTLQILSLIVIIVGIVAWVGHSLTRKGRRVPDEAEAALLGGQQQDEGIRSRVANLLPGGFFQGHPNYGAGFYQPPGYSYPYPMQQFPGVAFPGA
jgi:hypothetical protein